MSKNAVTGLRTAEESRNYLRQQLQLKIKEWKDLNKDKVELISVKDICLVEKIHKTANRYIYFEGWAKKLHSKNIEKLNSILVVRKSELGKYALVLGYHEYVSARMLKQKEINVIVVDVTREEFIKMVNPIVNKSFIKVNKQNKLSMLKVDTLNFQEIFITKAMKNTVPKTEKLDKHRSYFKRHRKVDKPVTININKDGKKVLVDGYIRYLVLRENGIQEIPVQYMSIKELKSRNSEIHTK